MLDYTRELPENVKLSEYHKAKADGYIRVQSLGKSYYIPLTKDMKKIFGIKRKKGDIEIEFSIMDADRLDDMIRIIINAVYLQTRDTVGMEIREEMVKMVEDKLNNVLVPQIDSEIEKKFEDKEPKLLDQKLKPTELYKPTQEEIVDAYKQGLQAYKNGVGYNHNPYFNSCVLNRYWSRGWMAGELNTTDEFMFMKMTCNECVDKDCEFRDDPYNINGDCLAEK